MNYEGPGFYRHYKGGLYRVIGLSLRESSVNKPGENIDRFKGPEVTDVIYEPMSTPSFLDDRDERFWERPLEPGMGPDPFNHPPGRFTRIYCAQCGNGDDLTPVGGGMLVCEVCGGNTGIG